MCWTLKTIALLVHGCFKIGTLLILRHDIFDELWVDIVYHLYRWMYHHQSRWYSAYFSIYPYHLTKSLVPGEVSLVTVKDLTLLTPGKPELKAWKKAKRKGNTVGCCWIFWRILTQNWICKSCIYTVYIYIFNEFRKGYWGVCVPKKWRSIRSYRYTFIHTLWTLCFLQFVYTHIYIYI